jgi:hypothetical protein
LDGRLLLAVCSPVPKRVVVLKIGTHHLGYCSLLVLVLPTLAHSGWL